MLMPAVKPQWVRNNLGEAIEQSCSDFLAHTMEVCKSAHRTTSIRLSEDNHNSWVTCTSSAECKTVITAVLMVMSGMDPHMISWNLRWVWIGFGWDGLSKWVC